MDDHEYETHIETENHDSKMTIPTHVGNPHRPTYVMPHIMYLGPTSTNLSL